MMSIYFRQADGQNDLDRAVERAGGAWETLRGARVFLSGAGLTGVWLLAVLVQASRRLDLGVEAVILARDPRRFRREHSDLVTDGAVEVLAGTPADFAYPQGRFSHVVHLAGDEEGAAAIGYESFGGLFDGVRRVLDFAGDSGAGTVLLAGIGTAGLVPTENGGLFLDPADAGPFRAAALQMVESLGALAARRYGYGVTAVRCAPITGPGVAGGGPVTAEPFTGLYAADAAAWLWTILAKGTPGAVYDAGPGGIPALGLAAWTTPDEAVRRSRERGVLPDGTAVPADDPPLPAGVAEKPATFVIDVDGVVAMLTPGNDYRLCYPIPEVIAAINRLYDRGHRVVMMTARGSATGIDWEETTRGQFARWGLKFHELRFGKPAADYYVDDRILSIEMMCAMAAGRRFPPSTRAPRLSTADGVQEKTGTPCPVPATP